MKKIHLAFLLACVFTLCLAMAGCGGEAPQSSSTEAESSSAATQAQSTASAPSSTEAAPAETTITAADLANVDTVIEYGDYDAMSNLSANIQNARAEGTVVQIEGMVVNYGSGMSYSIVEPNEDNSTRIGTVFKIEGAQEADYPKDGQRAKITGIVGSDETGYTYFIKTLPEFVEIVG